MTSNTCTVEGCDRPRKALGYCGAHYARYKRNGNPGPAELVRNPLPEKCVLDGCDRKAAALGYCTMHRRRVIKHGDPGQAEPLTTPAGTLGPVCVLEGCDRPRGSGARGYCPTHTRRIKRNGNPGPAGLLRAENGDGSLDPIRGYRTLTIKGRRILEHRHVMERTIGRPLWADENVHHINGNRADNRPENLELWSSSQPAGQRVIDKLAWATEILVRYIPEHPHAAKPLAYLLGELA